MIGIITNNIDSLDLDEINRESGKDDITIFHDNVNPSIRYENISSMSKHSSYDFRGDIITTCLLSCSFTLKNPSCDKIVFWPHAVEWYQWNSFFYSELKEIIMSDKIKILCTDKDVAKVYTDMFRKPDLYIDSFDINLLKEKLL